MRRSAWVSAAVVGLAIAAAFAIRVLPAWDSVMTGLGVSFQDGDSWYHMRVVHNLAAHFPHQSGFDPYASLPSQQDAHTDPWDLAVAGVAWTIGLGSPSEGLIDRVGAWMPAVLGALLPIPLFFLTKRLFGDAAARWSALAIAVIPGTILWASHLGVPDHHVAECLLHVCALLALCGAVESEGRVRLVRVALAGMLFGIYLCVRPAGIFVPATLSLAVLLEPALAPFVVACLTIASAIFLTSSGSVWASFTWFTLAGCVAICLLVWAVNALWRKRAWPKVLLLPALGVAACVAIALAAVVAPTVFSAMIARIRLYLPGGASIANRYGSAELIPLWAIPPGGIGSLFEGLGTIWLPALPVLLFAVPTIWRTRRPVLVLCSVWGLVMVAAGVLQMRMWVYGAPALAVAAGAGCAWLMAEVPRFKTVISLATAALLLGTCLPRDVHMMRINGGPRPDWRQALTWMRRNTPEPLGDPNAWLRAWPALRPGEKFAYPASAYSVLTWWDFGDWVNAIGHRIPSTNGTQTNTESVAAFLTATSSEEARPIASTLSARYAVLGYEVHGDIWDLVVQIANRESSQFTRVLLDKGPEGYLLPIRIYLPDYYRAMAVHMYAFDGRAIQADPEVSVFTTKKQPVPSGPELDALVEEKKFPTEKEALEFIRLHPEESPILGSRDPLKSCVNVEELTQVKQVYATGDPGLPGTVKVFELLP